MSANAEGEAGILSFVYRNWKDEVSIRRVQLPVLIFYGTTEWHPKPQYMLSGFDVEKSAERHFALRDINFIHDLYPED